MEYTSTMVVFRDGVAEDNSSTQVWSHNKILEPNFGKKEGQNNGSSVVSFHHVQGVSGLLRFKETPYLGIRLQ